jgi:hypothetical protein
VAFPIPLFPEGCGFILKELFKPAVKDGGLKLLFLAKVGYRYLLNQMPAKAGDFLVRGVMLAMLDHGVPSVSLVLLYGGTLHFQLRQNKDWHTIRDCYDKNKFPFKFRKMIQIFDGHNKAMNFSNLDPTVPGQKL